MLLEFREENNYNPNEKPPAVTETRSSSVSPLGNPRDQSWAPVNAGGSSDELRSHLPEAL